MSDSLGQLLTELRKLCEVGKLQLTSRTFEEALGRNTRSREYAGCLDNSRKIMMFLCAFSSFHLPSPSKIQHECPMSATWNQSKINAWVSLLHIHPASLHLAAFWLSLVPCPFLRSTSPQHAWQRTTPSEEFSYRDMTSPFSLAVSLQYEIPFVGQ